MRTVVLPLVVAIAFAFAATAHGATVEPCGVIAHDYNRYVTYYLSVLQAKTTCEDAATIADEWSADLSAGRIPDAVFMGGHERFGARWAVGGYACRDRRLGSDIGEVWCRSGDGRVVGWARHRGYADSPERPHYPDEAPRGWDVEPMRIPMPRLTKRETGRHLREVLAVNFYEAYSHSYARRFGCRRVSRIRFRCQPSWIIGDGVYHGTAWVWNKRELTKISWDYAWRITLTDEYCVYTRGRNCTRVYRR